MTAGHDERVKFLRGVLVVAVAAADLRRQLVSRPTALLSVSERDRVRSCERLMRLAVKVCTEFVANGSNTQGVLDLGNLPWWPDAGRTAAIVLELNKLVSRLRTHLGLGRYNPNALDPTATDLETFDPANPPADYRY